MDNNRDLRRKPRDQKASFIVQKIPSLQKNGNSKFQDKLELSYGDSQGEIVKKDSSSPMAPEKNQMLWRKGKVTEEDEVVKYMHNLPCYLKEGKNPSGKILNVGVLDWRRLEKWQRNQKKVALKSGKSGKSSPTSSNDSSFFTTDRSSVNSSREQSCSPSHLNRHRPTLQSHLRESPKVCYSETTQLPAEDSQKVQDLNTGENKRKAKHVAGFSLGGHPETKLEPCKGKAAPEIALESGVPSNLEFTRKMNIQDGSLTRGEDKSALLTSNVADEGYVHARKPETVVLILPKGSPKINCSTVSPLPDYKTRTIQRPKKASRESFSGKSYSEERCSFSDSSCTGSRGSFQESVYSQESQNVEFYSSAYTCPLSRKVDSCKESNLRQQKSPNRHVTDRCSSASVKAVNHYAKKASEDPPLQKISAVARNLSPARRFSISIDKTSKKSSFQNDLVVPQLTAKHSSSEFVRERGFASASASLDKLSSDKLKAATRSRSSPLRRLLDPLMKPKVPSSHIVVETLGEDLASTDGRSSSTIKHSVKAKLDFSGCRTVEVISLCQNEKLKSRVLHALLKVAYKNGLPLFTLAVDHETDVLAATGRNSSTLRKDARTYTFFTVREIKKKAGGWISQGSKDKSHGYIPNVIAQMKVSDSPSASSSCLDAADKYKVREFVLLSADQKQADQQSTNSEPNLELAAIVTKIPIGTDDIVVNDRHYSRNDNRSEISLKASNPITSAEIGQNGSVGNGNSFSMTAILQNGVHSVPAKGGPSSLIERWESGGSCDCGGWDLGCKLQVLVNENQLPGTLVSCSTSDQFDLFYQDEFLEKQPGFTLTPLKDGLFSVEFHSSLSHLQAFSICIAVLDSRKLLALQQDNVFDEKTQDRTITPGSDEIRNSYGVQGELPAKYASYPPLSPAGRV